MRSTTCCRVRSRGLYVAAAAIAAATLLAPAPAPAHGSKADAAATEAVLAMTAPGSSGATTLDALWRRLREQPGNARYAAAFMVPALRAYAVNADTRLLGFADRALSPWRDDAAPPPSIWVLRGRVLQSQHRFAAAAADLDRLLETHPDMIEARLLAADSWRRAGRIDAARRHCLRLQFAAETGIARLCAADVLMAVGRGEEAFGAARDGVETIGEAGDEDVAWAYSVLADAARAAGRPEAARQAYETALDALQPAPLALNLAYVDLLIGENHLSPACRVLEELPQADAVLLRKAMVAARSDAGHFADARHELEHRYKVADAAGADDLHWRERAIFALYVADDPALALAYAEKNWRAQKGWEDGELLMRAAAAAGRPSAALLVTEWREDR